MGYYPNATSVRARSCRAFYIAFGVVLVFFFGFIYTPLPNHYDNRRVAVLQQLTETAKEHLSSSLESVKAGYDQSEPSLAKTDSKYAFATFLASSDNGEIADKYFTAVRILAYQLHYAPETKSNGSVPLIVLVTPEISEEKRARLRRDGAIVWEAEKLESNWAKTDIPTWQDVFMKLRLWELTQFERIAFLDGDTVLAAPMDGVFNDPAVARHDTFDSKPVREDEAPLPSTFAFASVPEMKPAHHYPPTEEGQDYPNRNYLNAGFFVMQPSLDLLAYYQSLLGLDGRFNPHLPEQNLLNYAHRREGNMPWKAMANTWNIHYPSPDDLMGGVASLHVKWWAPEYPDLRPYLESWRWRMEGFYEARDALTVGYGGHDRWNDAPK